MLIVWPLILLPAGLLAATFIPRLFASHFPAHHGPVDKLMYPIEVGLAADKCRQRLYNAPLPSDYPPTRRAATITSLRPLPTWWCGEWRITDVGLVNGQQPRHYEVLVTMSPPLPPPPPPTPPSQIQEMHCVLGTVACCHTQTSSQSESARPKGETAFQASEKLDNALFIRTIFMFTKTSENC